jgi:PadR family transcriptional regulator, regulatory protein PadR
MDLEWKKGSAELLILSLLEDQPRHGYDVGKLIESRSGGRLRFHIASLYPLLYRLENRGLIQGRWVEKPNQRRRRYYRLTTQGQKTLTQQPPLAASPGTRLRWLLRCLPEPSRNACSRKLSPAIISILSAFVLG